MKTGQPAGKQCPLTSFHFSGKEKQPLSLKKNYINNIQQI